MTENDKLKRSNALLNSILDDTLAQRKIISKWVVAFMLLSLVQSIVMIVGWFS